MKRRTFLSMIAAATALPLTSIAKDKTTQITSQLSQGYVHASKDQFDPWLEVIP